MTAHLYEKRGLWHIVLVYTNAQGKRAQKWINTNLTIKGNNRRAKQMMNQAIREWEPVLEPDVAQPTVQQPLVIQPELVESDADKSDSPSGVLFYDYLTVWLEDRRPKLEETTYGGYQHDIAQIVLL